jgi:hypothetical protein
MAEQQEKKCGISPLTPYPPRKRRKWRATECRTLFRGRSRPPCCRSTGGTRGTSPPCPRCPPGTAVSPCVGRQCCQRLVRIFRPAPEKKFEESQNINKLTQYVPYRTGTCRIPVLRIRDVSPGSRVKKITDPGSGIQVILTLKLFLSSRKNNLGCSSRIRIFPSRIPVPVVKKAPDPGSETS